MNLPKAFADLHKLSEDERIDLIGHYVCDHKQTAAVCIDANPPEKADRYIEKLTRKFPGLRVIGRGPGPVPGVVTVKVGPVDEAAN